MADPHDRDDSNRPDDDPTGEQPVVGDQPTGSSSSGQSDERTVREYRGAGIMWSGVAIVVFAAVFVVVAVQNAHDVEFQFLWMTTMTPLVLLVAITIAVTLVVDEVVGFLWRHRRRSRLRERDELRRLRSES